MHSLNPSNITSTRTTGGMRHTDTSVCVLDFIEIDQIICVCVCVCVCVCLKIIINNIWIL